MNRLCGELLHPPSGSSHRSQTRTNRNSNFSPDEVLQLVLNELDDPTPLSRVSKRFLTFSQDPYVRASYFLARHGKLQALFYAFGRGKLMTEKVIDVRTQIFFPFHSLSSSPSFRYTSPSKNSEAQILTLPISRHIRSSLAVAHISLGI